MKKKLFFIVFFSFQLFAQKQQISVDDIYNGTFRPAYLWGLKAMPESDKYSKIERRGNAFELGSLFDYATHKKFETAFSTAKFPYIGYFEYEFSPDENKILISSDIKQIYRHSTQGIYSPIRQKNKAFGKD